MGYNEIWNGIASISSATKAYEKLCGDVIDPCVFLQETEKVLNVLCKNLPCDKKGIEQGENPAGLLELGVCSVPLPQSKALLEVIYRWKPELVCGDKIVHPVKLDYEHNFLMALEVDDYAEDSSILAQFILLSVLEKKHEAHFRCADMVKGGSFFAAIYNLISKFPSKSGGKVYKSSMELDALIKELDNVSSATIAALGIAYDSVHHYNQVNTVKLPEYINILYLNFSHHSEEEINRLKILLRNRRKNGMSFILVGDHAVTKEFADITDYYFRYQNKKTFAGYKANLPFLTNESVRLSVNNVVGLEEKIQRAGTIDTIYAHHPELQTEYLTMDATKVLRIPFALNDSGLVEYFEIGGDAPPHALLSGSTGSGKSVALHTLIMQTIYHYHPDDVEIWAIDYKAVEFDWYIQHKTPHFRVIAHDTSVEFSLSLLDLLNEEYERRMKKFLEVGVKNIGEYREKMGSRSMTRIIVLIDEFQIMTQAVQTYSGNTDYRTVLENLLKLTRAMGISFILCSQTIASGLSGLTESARDQIGCRLCLKHDDDNEIRETLMLSGADAAETIVRAKNLRKGRGIYKRTRMSTEHAADGKSYEFRTANILYISDEIKEKIVTDIIRQTNNDFSPKQQIFARGGGRIAITEKERHPIQQFMRAEYESEEDCLEWYPAAPTSLADCFCVKLENTAGANMLLVGENDELRESIVIHSLCGFLMNPDNQIVFTVIDESYADRKRMIERVSAIKSDRLVCRIGTAEALQTIGKLKKIKPSMRGNVIYVWYGLDKLKNQIFLREQEKEETEEQTAELQEKQESTQDMINDLLGFLSDLNGGVQSNTNTQIVSDDEDLSYEDCAKILRQAFEVGSENNQYHFAIFNNHKVLKKCGLIDLDNFENRIGTRMPVDDSYELFGSSLAINKTDDNTVIYFAGSGSVVPLRPYLLPDEDWYDKFNRLLQ